ncbi:MAG: COX15/CtaA family protein [Chitinophagales bacterium]|nr:COX15/CtaA family protein [Chitinophagaceae bacterium]MCB9063969.1 COX15/CtaA family protein [Chitinophagales bacterium]
MSNTSDKKRKVVAYWLLAGVFMIMVQVLLGGVTRLTGSGLSITEWKPILGAIPPMNEKEWQEAFDGYKEIAQYKYLNSHFELSDFKSIYFWEWLHRQWARVFMSGVFLIGFVYFLIKKYFEKDMVIPLIILFILGAAQGLVGWIMVASGLNDTNLYVDHIKLAIHFMSALVLLCYTLWFALKLLIPDTALIRNNRLNNFTLATIVVLCIQLIYGAFMAGMKAAMNAPTWPSINGMYIPNNIMQQSFISHPINVHFMHRQIAYLLFTLVILWFGAATRAASYAGSSMLKRTRWWPFVLVWVQVILGIVTVISAPKIQFGKFGTFELLAELHQLFAMFLLMSLLVNAYIIRRAKA